MLLNDLPGERGDPDALRRLGIVHPSFQIVRERPEQLRQIQLRGENLGHRIVIARRGSKDGRERRRSFWREEDILLAISKDERCGTIGGDDQFCSAYENRGIGAGQSARPAGGGEEVKRSPGHLRGDIVRRLTSGDEDRNK